MPLLLSPRHVARVPSYIWLCAQSRKAHSLAHANLQALDAAKGDRERVVILGSGWAGWSFFDDSDQGHSIDRTHRLHSLSEPLSKEVPNPGCITTLLLRFHSTSELRRKRYP